MKPSNFQTPRTLSEATFTVGYSSARSYRKQRTGYGAAWWVCVCALALLGLHLSGWAR